MKLKTWLRSLWVIVPVLALLTGCAARQPVDATLDADLFAAARSGDLSKVRQLIEGGLPVDRQDKYGSTALIMAAGAGEVEVLRYLIEQGADVNHKESFYGADALSQTLFTGDHTALPLLLAAGADNRELVLQVAIREGKFELVQAVLASGPLYRSTVEQLLERRGALHGKVIALLEQAATRPDPPLPELDAAELKKYEGKFEGQVSDARIEVVAVGERLEVTINGKSIEVEISGEDSFRATDGTAELAFFGRAGSIEGIQWSQPGWPPVGLRHSVAEPVGTAGFTGSSDRAVAATATVHWPAFRGSAAAGVGDGRELATEWDDDSLLWSVEIEGLGNSSPIVWGDRVFLTTAVAEGVDQKIRTGLTGDGGQADEAVEHVWKVLAFDKWTGERLWETEIGRALPLTRRHFKSSQANSTPVTDGEHLIVTFPTVGIACLDLDGELKWSRPLGALNAGAFTDPGMEWGFASSPTLYGESVILQVDVHGGQYLAAWRLDDGSELWRTERHVAPSWATPTILHAASGDELIVNGSTIKGYDPTNGDELWSLGPNSELVIATPVVAHDLVYVSAGYPPVKPIYAIRAGTRGHFEVVPGDEHPQLAWSQNRGGAYMPSPLVYRGLLYVVHHNGRLVTYDAATGSAIYKSRFSSGGTFTASPVAANGRIYMPTEEGQVYVIEAGPVYREIAVNEMAEPLMATPAISEGLLFLRTPTRLVAVGNARTE